MHQEIYRNILVDPSLYQCFRDINIKVQIKKKCRTSYNKVSFADNLSYYNWIVCNLIIFSHRYNWIKIDDMIKCAKEIQTSREKNGTCCQPMLQSLILSGNRLKPMHFETIRNLFVSLVVELEINSIDISAPSDHVAQM